MAKTRNRNWLKLSTIALVFLVVGAVAGWSLSVLLNPPKDVLDGESVLSATVVEGSVESSLALNTLAEWDKAPVGVNRLHGVVTSVTLTGSAELKAGSVLYSVSMQPVVAAQGTVPAYRSLSYGAQGADVTQLQSFLRALGFHKNSPSGFFDWPTYHSVKAWQKSLGTSQTGEVSLGSLIFIPELPVVASLDNEVVYRDATLTGGESVLRGAVGSPLFYIPVTQQQAMMVPSGAKVVIRVEGQEWTGFVTGQQPSAESSQTVNLLLSGSEDAVICGEECGVLKVDEINKLQSTIVLQEPVSGAVVPTSAIQTDASGQTFVLSLGGEQIAVTILASARGQAVVEGVDIGTVVRLGASGS